jgi:hypothetical protein
MKFEVQFRSSSSTYLRGLNLLDTVRSIKVDAVPSEVHDSVYVEGDFVAELSEEAARASELFTNTNKITVRITVSKDYLAGLVRVSRLKNDSWSGLLIPVIEYDTEACLNAWKAQGYSLNMSYPTEPDPEEESEEF